MTINLFFITLTLSVSKRKNSKEEFERNLEVQKRMEQSKEKVFIEFHNM
ncbi:YrzI family small protein [Metabacillus bambusae]|uniref:YrzI family small protein n=1 Tax=Metabacillus bambusae TaxID=2795218 RepID=A0ABS3N2F9_9BACI|nr:YrzI family small protein [Metabacillus bambusae]MBO1512230.1 YrzI family small protein [Metabacillus bambusae]